MNQDFFNHVTLGVLASLLIYHLMIYLKRRERIYLFFFYFIFSCLAFIIFNTEIHTLFIYYTDKSVYRSICRQLVMLFIVHSSIKFISESFDLDKKNKIYGVIYILQIFNIIFSSSSILILGRSYYDGYILKFVTLIEVIIILVLFSVLFIPILKIINKLGKLQKIIFLGFFLMANYMLLTGAAISFKILLFLKGNYTFLSIVIFVFSYALARQFNQEHNDLIDLKNDLEQRVEDRTEDLKISKIEIEELSQQKTDFFINLSHEIRTPLTLIKVYFDSYIKNSNIKENKEIIVIKNNFDKLERDILNFITRIFTDYYRLTQITLV